jgi:hypothetical protein
VVGGFLFARFAAPTLGSRRMGTTVTKSFSSCRLFHGFFCPA